MLPKAGKELWEVARLTSERNSTGTMVGRGWQLPRTILVLITTRVFFAKYWNLLRPLPLTTGTRRGREASDNWGRGESSARSDICSAMTNIVMGWLGFNKLNYLYLWQGLLSSFKKLIELKRICLVFSLHWWYVRVIRVELLSCASECPGLGNTYSMPNLESN